MKPKKRRKQGGFESLLNKILTNKTLNPTPASLVTYLLHIKIKQTCAELGPNPSLATGHTQSQGL